MPDEETPPKFEMPYFYSRGRGNVRRAVLRGTEPGTVSDVIIPDPGTTYREAERELVDTAQREGREATERTIQISGPPVPPPDRGLVSYPGKTVRPRTRDEANHRS